MSNPKISIVIPFYNVDKRYFDQCISSVLNQTFKDYEVIIINDGSEESYISYLDSKCKDDAKIAVYHTNNQGVSEARNLGIKRAKGETICFIDSDDYVAPWMLEDLWKIYSQSDAQAVASRYRMVFEDGYEFKRNNETYTIDASEMLKTTLVGMNCNPNDHGYLSAGPVAVLFDSNIAKDIPFPSKIKYMEDVIWNYQFFLKSKKVAIAEECVYAYRQNNSSATHTYKLNMIDDRIKTLLLIKDLCGENNEWYALRVLANYSICCKCCMRTDELSGFRDRISRVRTMNKDPVWKACKPIGITKHWDRKYRIKKFLADSGLMPLLYMIRK